jgi:hypothetical protein
MPILSVGKTIMKCAAGQKQCALVYFVLLGLLTARSVSTPCPAEGEVVTSLPKGFYSYFQCPFPVSVLAVNVSNVVMTLVNTSVAQIIFSGFFVVNSSLEIIDTAEPWQNKSIVSFVVDEIRDVAVVFLRSNISAGSDAVIVSLNVTKSVRNFYVNVNSSSLRARRGSDAILEAKSFESNANGTNWSNISIIVSKSHMQCYGRVFGLQSLAVVFNVSLVVCGESTVSGNSLAEFDMVSSTTRVRTLFHRCSFSFIDSSLTTPSYGIDVRQFLFNASDVSLNVRNSRFIVSDRSYLLGFVRARDVAGIFLWIEESVVKTQYLVACRSGFAFLNTLAFDVRNSSVAGTFVSSDRSDYTREVHNVIATAYNSTLISFRNSLVDYPNVSVLVENIAITLVDCNVTTVEYLLSVIVLQAAVQDITVLARRCTLNTSVVQLWGRVGYSMTLSRVRVAVESSSLKVSLTIVLFANASSTGNMSVIFSNATALYSALWLFSVHHFLSVNDALQMIITNSSYFTADPSWLFPLNTFCILIASIVSVRAVISVTISDSTFISSVYSYLLSSAFLFVANVSLTSSASGPCCGRLAVVVNNSTFEMKNLMEPASDICSFMSAIDVMSPRFPQALSLIINNSHLSISCAKAVNLLLVQECLVLSVYSESADSSFVLISGATKDVDEVTGMRAGSGILLVLNSDVPNVDFAIDSCSIQCGNHCLLVGTSWSGGSMYQYSLMRALNIVPSSAPHIMISSGNIALRKIKWAVTGAVVLQRSMMSLTNVSNTTFIFEGPSALVSGLFDGFVSDSGGPSSHNTVRLEQCENITFPSDSLGVAPRRLALSDVAPHGLPYATLISSCHLSATHSSEPTASAATQTASASLTRSASLELPRGPRSLSLGLKVVGAAVMVTALSAGPGAAIALQTLHAQGLVSGCSRNANDDDQFPAPPDVATSPTQIRIGSDTGSYDRGTVSAT